MLLFFFLSLWRWRQSPRAAGPCVYQICEVELEPEDGDPTESEAEEEGEEEVVNRRLKVSNRLCTPQGNICYKCKEAYEPGEHSINFSFTYFIKYLFFQSCSPVRTLPRCAPRSTAAPPRWISLWRPAPPLPTDGGLVWLSTWRWQGRGPSSSW